MKILYWVLSGLALLLIILILVYYFMNRKTESVSNNATPTVTATATVAASSTVGTTGEVAATPTVAKTAKEVHCLQSPVKGTSIVINNLADYQIAKSPLTLTGTANAFENQFQYTLRDCRGPIITQGSITAEGEMGSNPPYTKTINFTPKRSPLDAILEVYEISQADGNITSLYQVPLRLTN